MRVLSVLTCAGSRLPYEASILLLAQHPAHTGLQAFSHTDTALLYWLTWRPGILDGVLLQMQALLVRPVVCSSLSGILLCPICTAPRCQCYNARHSAPSDVHCAGRNTLAQIHTLTSQGSSPVGLLGLVLQRDEVALGQQLEILPRLLLDQLLRHTLQLVKVGANHREHLQAMMCVCCPSKPEADQACSAQFNCQQ